MSKTVIVQKKIASLLQHFIKTKIEYIWSKSHVIKDNIGWLDCNADLCLLIVHTSQTSNT